MIGEFEAIWWLGQHLLITTVLAGVVLFTCRLFRLSPAAQHVLWLVVLCRLIVPSIGIWPWSIPVDIRTSSERPNAHQAAVNSAAETGIQSSALDRSHLGIIVATDVLDRNLAVRESHAAASEHSNAAAAVTRATANNPHRPLWFSWPSLMAGAWVIGSLAVATVLFRRIRRIGCALNAEHHVAAWLQAEVAEWCRQLAVRTPDCIVTDAFRSPFLWCPGRVRLVWPQVLADPEHRQQMRPVLLHELAHLKRRDHWMTWIELTAHVIWWWNPLFWLIRRQLRTASEMACDAWVVQLLPDERRAYAESLVEISGRRSMTRFAVGAVGADTGSRRAFRKRLEMIMNEQVSARFSRWTILLGTLLGVISLPAFSTETETPATDSAAASALEADADTTDGPSQTSGSESQTTSVAARSALDLAASDSQDDGAAESTVSLNELLEQIESNYYGPVDRDQLERAAIEAILSSLDANTQLLSREQLSEMKITIDGELAGVGVAIEIDSDTNQPIVTRPIRHSPAHTAGVRTGDVILSIDGEATAGLDLTELLERIRGPRGSTVTLRIQSADETRDVEIVRDNLPVLGIEAWSVADDQENYRFDAAGGTGYVHIPAFTKQTSPQLRQVLAHLNASGVTGLVLDLRNCGGGLLTAATEVADMFLDEGIIVSSRGRDESDTVVIRATADGTFKDLRLAVLVNGYTASAAEILAACLQDHHRAAIIGEQTFGRGTVQSLLPLNDGSALKLTTAAWLRPNGRGLQRNDDDDVWGVQPDPGYAVPLADADRQRLNELYRQRLDGVSVDPDDDPQLQTALEWLQRG